MDRTFSGLLAEHADGNADEELTKLLREALAVANQRNRKTEITVKVTFLPKKGRTTEIAFAASSKLPAEEPDSYLYYTDDDGFPVTKNPRQMELPLRRVEEPSNA